MESRTLQSPEGVVEVRMCKEINEEDANYKELFRGLLNILAKLKYNLENCGLLFPLPVTIVSTIIMYTAFIISNTINTYIDREIIFIPPKIFSLILP